MPTDAIVHCDSFEVPLKVGPDIADVTPFIGRIVADAGVNHGSAHVVAIGSTASMTTIEFEPGAVEDLKRAIERIAPPDMVYAHEMTWHDGNGHSHVQAAMIGPSLIVPIRDGRLRLGTWQQVILINHDIHGRRRVVEVTVIGTA
ncbi:MAG: YjbQ family protein [Hyphomicrobiales bacterium]|nr:YjbQ family protein [Hyphomicrobiales bacterium]